MAPTAPDEVRDDAPIGVAACDTYLRVFAICATKAPPEAQAAFQASAAQMKAAWRQAAHAGPNGRDALETACGAAMDALRANPMCK